MPCHLYGLVSVSPQRNGPRKIILMDHLTPERRSWNMSRIRGRDTAPERAVRSALHRIGFRFRVLPSALPGHPDVVLPRYRTAIFVHGCFWHRHPGCRYTYSPKSNITFWAVKFSQNTARDTRVRKELRAKRWRVVVVWECQTVDDDGLISRLRRHPALRPSIKLQARSRHTFR
jgi:DNA mismatch endonuclease (patch repair protein)